MESFSKGYQAAYKEFWPWPIWEFQKSAPSTDPKVAWLFSQGLPKRGPISSICLKKWTRELLELSRNETCSGRPEASVPRTRRPLKRFMVHTFNNQNHLFCRLPINSIQGFIIRTYKSDGSGSQWYTSFWYSKYMVNGPSWGHNRVYGIWTPLSGLFSLQGWSFAQKGPHYTLICIRIWNPEAS